MYCFIWFFLSEGDSFSRCAGVVSGTAAVSVFAAISFLILFCVSGGILAAGFSTNGFTVTAGAVFEVVFSAETLGTVSSSVFFAAGETETFCAAAEEASAGFETVSSAE